jgi:CheY-like chemotaxis protein
MDEIDRTVQCLHGLSHNLHAQVAAGAGMLTSCVSGEAGMTSRPTIMIVEDDYELSTIVGGVLAEAGYTVVAAGNGSEALEVLLKGKVSPALILLDLRMPVMDGWEFVRVVRCYRRLATIPVVVIATPAVGSRLAPQVEGTLPKPFSTEALLAEVRKHAPLELKSAG